MKILYPEGVDNFNLQRSREDRNLTESGHLPTVADALVAIRELQKRVGIIGSSDALALDYRINQLEGLVADLIASGGAPGAAASSAITTAGTTVSYGSTLSPAPIGIKVVSCKNASNEDVGVEITNITTTGFDAKSYPDNATLVWETVLAH